MTAPALEVRQLTKSYGTFRAVQEITFTVPAGGVIGLLGPNGAGKTTTIQMLMGITEPTSGSIHYFGQDFSRHRQACLQRINYTSAYNRLQGRISVYENLRVFAELYGVRNAKAKVAELVGYFELDELVDKKFWHLSAGQQTRVNIAKSLLNDPDLVMMDEPTASLDPDIRDKVMTLIESARRERGLALLFTSHNMDEVTRICDEVVFLDHGKILRQATPDALAAEVHTPMVALAFRGPQQTVIDHFTRIAVEVTDIEPEHVTFVAETHEVAGILGSVHALPDITVTDIDIRKPSLEDAFLHFTRNNNA
jgi:ABC-2 type transport system ATP-binding protein